MVIRTGVFGAMTREHREQFISLAREVSFAEGERILNEVDKTDRFWIIRTGTATLGLHVPGRRAAVIGAFGAGRLLGWSWLVPPRYWNPGAETGSPVSAYDLDGTTLREMCAKDPRRTHELCAYVSGVLARRSRSARV
ncbi:cyclic nucleotide-binding domain-containing protein [Streptomyces prasinus]|uniref:cyclic nucleotide-binding domain-containing protein n=1 Tax=Streptomyces prasinus TaxID=67345 RepID=UPI0033D3AD91